MSETCDNVLPAASFLLLPLYCTSHLYVCMYVYELSYLSTRYQVRSNKGSRHVCYSSSTSMLCVHSKLRNIGNNSIVLSCYIKLSVTLVWHFVFLEHGWVSGCCCLLGTCSHVIVFAPGHPHQQYPVGTTAAKPNRSIPQRPRAFLPAGSHTCVSCVTCMCIPLLLLRGRKAGDSMSLPTRTSFLSRCSNRIVISSFRNLEP